MNRLRIAIILHPDAPVYRPEEPVFGFDPEDVYLAPLLRGIVDGAAGAPVDLVYARLHPDNYLGYLIRERVDGAILLCFEFTDYSTLSPLRDAGLPYVAIGGAPPPNAPNYPCVDASNLEAGRSAAQYLINRGHKRLGCVNLAGDFTNHSDRMQGFCQAAAEMGSPVDFAHLLTEYRYERPSFRDYTAQWVGRLVAQGSLPTALFACDYWMAEATREALRRYDIGVPGQVSLIGFDDPPAAEAMEPPLTTISQPVAEIGRRSAERVIEALTDPDGRRQVIGTELLPTILVERASVGPPPD